MHSVASCLNKVSFIVSYQTLPPPVLSSSNRIFHLVPLRKTLSKAGKGAIVLLFCYLFIPLIAIMMPIHSYHNSPAFSADG